MISTKPAALIRVSLPTQSEAEQSLIAQGISDHNLRDSTLELNKLLGNQDIVEVNWTTPKSETGSPLIKY